MSTIEAPGLKDKPHPLYGQREVEGLVRLHCLHGALHGRGKWYRVPLLAAHPPLHSVE